MSKQTIIENVVFDYMKEKNRPYSVLDIFNNLHKEHGKTAIGKALEALTESGKMLEKVYGKSKIYVVHQSIFPDIADDELNVLDKEYTSVQDAVASVKKELHMKNNELSSILSSPTTVELKKQVSTLKTEVESLSLKLKTLQNNAGNVKYSAADKEKLLKNHENFRKEFKKRKRYTTDIMDAVLEGYPKSKKQFIEEVGLEID